MSTAQPDTDDSAAFEAIVDVQTLQEFVATLTPVVNEGKLQLTDDGLRTVAVDPANVAMIDSTLLAAAFDHYERSGAIDVIGINLERFDEVLGFGDSNDVVELVLDAETRTLTVTIDALEYTLALIDPDAIRQEPDLPDLDLTAEIVLEGRDLDRGLTATDMVGDHVTLRSEKDDEAEAFVLEAEGDTDTASLAFDRADVIDATVDESASSFFSIDYLNEVTKPISADTEVRVDLGTEFPIELCFEYADGAGDALYVVAPRITTD